MNSEPAADDLRLDTTIRELRDRSLPPGPPADLATRTASAMRVAGRPVPRRRWAPAAVAAAFAIGTTTFVGILLVDRTTPLAFAEVVQRVAAARTLAYVVGEGAEAATVFLKGDIRRVDGNTPDGAGRWTNITDLRTGEALLILPDQRHATLSRYVVRPGNPYEILRDVATHATEPLGEREFGGRKLVGFRGTMESPQANGSVVRPPVNIWVDPVTRLPVRIEYIDVPTGQLVDGGHDLRFDVPLDDALFAMTPPDGFKFTDRRGKDTIALRPPPTTREAQSLVIRPGVGIGDLKLGDPPARVIALLGEPEKPAERSLKTLPWDFDYPSRGLRFTLMTREGAGRDGWPTREEDLGVYSIFADDANVRWSGHAFAGETAEGIRLGSTRAEVEAVYGKPSWQNTQNADYRERGLAVIFRADGEQVSGFLIVKPTTQPIFGTVK